MTAWAFVIALEFAFFLSVELWQLSRHDPKAHPTLSRTVWRTQARFPILAFLVGQGVGGLAIHFFGWLPACAP